MDSVFAPLKFLVQMTVFVILNHEEQRLFMSYRSVFLFIIRKHRLLKLKFIHVVSLHD